MARPLKKGLGYFPLDTDFLSNRKIQRLDSAYGCQGICIYVCALCDIYGGNGYYAHYSSDFCFDLGFTLGLNEKLVEEVMAFCVQIRLFDSELLEKKQVLTSAGIQLRFREISKRSLHRIDPELDISLCAATGDKAIEVEVNATETPVNGAKTPTNGNGNGNRNTSTQKSDSNGNKTATDYGEEARRAELLRMATDATRGV